MKYDAVIIGAGHNGLVCAFYLAKAGMKVRVLERRDIVGGACVTEEFHPGFRNSTASYTVSLLRPQVIADMKLADHGYRVLERQISNFFPFADTYLKLGGGADRTRAEFARFSQKDADAYPHYDAALEKVAQVLRDLALQCPPNVGGGLHALAAAAKQGWPLAKMDLAAQRDLLTIFTRSAREFLDSWFEDDHVKSAFGFDAVVGNFAGVSTPGSAYVLLHHVFGEVNGKLGAWGHSVGGMGAITQAMAKACALVDSYLERTSERKELMDTITYAACHFQNDPHIMRNCASSTEEWHRNQTPRRDDIIRGWVKHQSRYIKRAQVLDAFQLYERHFTSNGNGNGAH